MKKFFSLVLALVMALSLTTVAWGADIATAGDIPASLTEGETYKLTGDVTLSTYWTIDKKVTIDLNGHSLTRASGTMFYVIAGGELTITDTAMGADNGIKGAETVLIKNGGSVKLVSGRIVTSSYGVVLAGAGDSFAMDGGSISGTADAKQLVSLKGGTFVMNDGTLTGAATGVFAYDGVVTMNGGQIKDSKHAVTIKEGSFEMNGGSVAATNCGVCTNGQYDADLTINDGTITGGGVGVYFPSEGTLTISGGSISGDTGVYVKSGSVNITGGTISGTGDAADYAFNANGCNSTGDALVIENVGADGYEAVSSVSVTGGTFTSAKGDAVASYAATSVNSSAVAKSEFVEGGTFSGDMDEALVADGNRLVNGTVSSVPANTTGVVGGYEGMFTFAGATRQAVTNLTKTPAVAPLDVDEDGYYNRAGDRLGSIEYYTLNLGGAVAQNYYKVNTVGEADLIIYVGDSKTPYMYLANEPAGGFTYLTGAAAFNNFGKACGQFKWAAVDTTKTYYAYDGKVYVANPVGDVNLMIGTSFIQATDVTANGTWVAHVPVYTQDKTGAVTAIKCANCNASAVIVANYAALPNAVKADSAYFNVPGSASKMFYWVDGIVVTPSTDKVVESAETFDAGIAMYVGMSVMAAAGSAVVIGKKKD